jgi:hypothetical protein
MAFPVKGREHELVLPALGDLRAQVDRRHLRDKEIRWMLVLPILQNLSMEARILVQEKTFLVVVVVTFQWIILP